VSEVQLLLTGEPLKGRLVLAHGSGMAMDHLFMDKLSNRLVEIGLQVIRFEFPYMAGRRVTGKRALPNPMPVLIDCYKQVVADVHEMSVDDDKPLFLAGKSLGGRVATLIADDICSKGVFVFGYPFHPVKKPEKLRTAHLAEISTKIEIFQGTRDALGNFDEVKGYDLCNTVAVNWLEDGDHDLKPRKRSGYTQEQHVNSAIKRIAEII
jgi:predicted alpha/beta-hydrolase family hydrolase